MPKFTQIGTRSSMGIRTRSGKKCFDNATLVSNYAKCLLVKSSPKKQVNLAKGSSKVRAPRKTKVSGSLYNKSYKFQLKKRIEQRKEVFGLKRASSRLAAKYFLSDEICDQRVKMIHEYMKLRKHELQQILRKNHQNSEGVKLELSQRISEGVIFGASPVCPHCAAGKLDFNFYTGTYSCLGYTDDNDDIVECKASYEFQDIINLVKPWRI